jgi:hypothetical protein
MLVRLNEIFRILLVNLNTLRKASLTGFIMLHSLLHCLAIKEQTGAAIE